MKRLFMLMALAVLSLVALPRPAQANVESAYATAAIFSAAGVGMTSSKTENQVGASFIVKTYLNDGTPTVPVYSRYASSDAPYIFPSGIDGYAVIIPVPVNYSIDKNGRFKGEIWFSLNGGGRFVRIVPDENGTYAVKIPLAEISTFDLVFKFIGANGREHPFVLRMVLFQVSWGSKDTHAETGGYVPLGLMPYHGPMNRKAIADWHIQASKFVAQNGPGVPGYDPINDRFDSQGNLISSAPAQEPAGSALSVAAPVPADTEDEIEEAKKLVETPQPAPVAAAPLPPFSCEPCQVPGRSGDQPVDGWAICARVPCTLYATASNGARFKPVRFTDGVSNGFVCKKVGATVRVDATFITQLWVEYTENGQTVKRVLYRKG